MTLFLGITISCSTNEEGTLDCSGFTLDVKNWTNNYNAWASQDGGEQPITYQWSNGSTDDTIGGQDGALTVGTYTVNATDGRGCTVTGSITIEHQLGIIESEVTCIGSYSAIITSDVTEIAGNAIIEKGVCFSTSSNPTINHTKVIANNVGLDFNSKLSSLALATKYYVRGYVINQGGISYSEEVNFTTQSSPSPFTIGQEYQGGIIAYINCDGLSGYIIYDDGVFDTYSWIRAKEICENNTFNGYSDWYLPNIIQLQQMYKNLHQTNIFKFETGATIYDNYWSSSEIYDSSACGDRKPYYLDFDNGNVERLEACYHLNFMPVRNF
ncbi:hypothetical protein PHEL85_3418 [Polaribacter sp. Hel1_85]|nr:hypothetical protein PHEL85_3418 [Polaribacter sp. Hel1_85]